MANYSTKNYPGADSPFNYNSPKYSVTPGSLGFTTDPRTANILKDVSGKLSSGIKQMELEFVSPEIFDSIPKQQLEEVRRLAKLTGVDLSIHGPVMDTAGFAGQQGFSELNRQASERRLIQTLERSHELKPEGNINVTFHSSEGILGSEFETLGPLGERKHKKLIAVNRQTGQMMPMESDVRYTPGGGLKQEIREKLESGKITNEQLSKQLSEGRITRDDIFSFESKNTPEENIDISNNSQWNSEITPILFNKEKADEILQQNYPLVKNLLESGESINPRALTQPQQEALQNIQHAGTYLGEILKKANSSFSKAYEYGNEEQRKALKKISDDFGSIIHSKEGKTVIGQANALQLLLDNLGNPNLAPEIFVPIEKFAIEKSSQTFGNTAYAAYKKFGTKAPIISIENPPAGHALSTAEDLRKLIEESRKKFQERLIKDEKMSERQAQQTAEKLIGATWDVGHINMIRKQGFSEKDVIKQAEVIAPMLKHVHLSDNFGFEHTELPMGMGNVPIKEIMEKLGQKGYEAKKIIEASGWWQHFQTPPLQETLEALGSPVYSMNMGPYWQQSASLQQGYFSGYGGMLPDIHYQQFGAGFSQLPSELGGSIGGGSSGGRMSGRPME